MQIGVFLENWTFPIVLLALSVPKFGTDRFLWLFFLSLFMISSWNWKVPWNQRSVRRKALYFVFVLKIILWLMHLVLTSAQMIGLCQEYFYNQLTINHTYKRVKNKEKINSFTHASSIDKCANDWILQEYFYNQLTIRTKVWKTRKEIDSFMFLQLGNRNIWFLFPSVQKIRTPISRKEPKIFSKKSMKISCSLDSYFLVLLLLCLRSFSITFYWWRHNLFPEPFY